MASTAVTKHSVTPGAQLSQVALSSTSALYFWTKSPVTPKPPCLAAEKRPQSHMSTTKSCPLGSCATFSIRGITQDIPRLGVRIGSIWSFGYVGHVFQSGILLMGYCICYCAKEHVFPSVSCWFGSRSYFSTSTCGRSHVQSQGLPYGSLQHQFLFTDSLTNYRCVFMKNNRSVRLNNVSY